MSEEDKLRLQIEQLTASITVGRAWELGRKSNEYSYSPQGQTDKRTLAIAKKKLKALTTQSTVTPRFTGVGNMR